MYDSSLTDFRNFALDYPNGAAADGSGRLLKTIDGDDIRARFVVGRNVVGGADQALPPAAFDTIAEAITGRGTQVVPPSAFGRSGTVGEVVVNKYSKRPELVQLSNQLTPEQLPRVYGHEIGHVVDQAAREIPVAGIDDPLRGIYNTQNNPQNYGKAFGPEQNRYKGADVPRELMAMSRNARWLPFSARASCGWFWNTFEMVPQEGFEPPTPSLRMRCSTS